MYFEPLLPVNRKENVLLAWLKNHLSSWVLWVLGGRNKNFKSKKIGGRSRLIPFPKGWKRRETPFLSPAKKSCNLASIFLVFCFVCSGRVAAAAGWSKLARCQWQALCSRFHGSCTDCLKFHTLFYPNKCSNWK